MQQRGRRGTFLFFIEARPGRSYPVHLFVAMLLLPSIRLGAFPSWKYATSAVVEMRWCWRRATFCFFEAHEERFYHVGLSVCDTPVLYFSCVRTLQLANWLSVQLV